MPLRRFRLYVDETGTDAMSGIEISDHRFLTVTGVAIEEEAIGGLHRSLAATKDAYFVVHPDDPPVVIHRSDMMRRNGPFQIFADRAVMRAFGEDWLNFLESAPITVFSVFIDKLAMSRRGYWRLRHPYHYAMELLTERFALFLERHGAHGDIMPEERRGKKDQALQAAFEEVRQRGTRYVAAERITAVIPASNLKFRGKASNVTGLQIADSVSYVIDKYIKANRIDRAIELSEYERRLVALLLDAKLDRSPTGRRSIWGYGLKVVP